MIHKLTPFYPAATKELVLSTSCYLYDKEGKEYIDFESGVWCANLGHNPQRIVDIINRQTRQTIHQGYRFYNSYAEDLASVLQRITGLSGGSSVFLSSGSEAVNLSITLARHFTGRKKILKINNSYLSAYGYGQISPGNELLVNIPFHQIEATDLINWQEIAAFVLETGGASIDMVQFPDNLFIERLVEKCIENRCLVIAEEVTTGIGRTGKWFGFQHYKLLPDIVVTGKGLGNGYPVSGVTLSRKWAEKFEQQPFRYAQSHQNDPLGCAVALEVIRTIEKEKVLLSCMQTGTYLKEKLTTLQTHFPEKIKDVRGRGLMLAFELFPTYKDILNGDILFEEGFVVGYKENSFRLMPPLVITQKEIDRFINCLQNKLSQ